MDSLQVRTGENRLFLYIYCSSIACEVEPSHVSWEYKMEEITSEPILNYVKLTEWHDKYMYVCVCSTTIRCFIKGLTFPRGTTLDEELSPLPLSLSPCTAPMVLRHLDKTDPSQWILLAIVILVVLLGGFNRLCCRELLHVTVHSLKLKKERKKTSCFPRKPSWKTTAATRAKAFYIEPHRHDIFRPSPH